MPPTIGAAIRFMVSDPVPWLHIIGVSAAMMAATVITTGRNCSSAPSTPLRRRQLGAHRSIGN